jgi:molecular chaperone GrpE
MTDKTVNEEALPEGEANVDEQPRVPDIESTPASPAELQDKINQLQDQLLRAQAELENFRRRSQREMADVRKYQSLPVVRDLLPAMDNLNRAVQAAEQTGDVTNLLAGIRMVVQQLADMLKANAAQLIDAEGKSFDPNLHEALSQVPTPDHPPMTVIQVVESGYVMHDRVVRPAKVIVSCAPPEAAAEVAPTEE